MGPRAVSTTLGHMTNSQSREWNSSVYHRLSSPQVSWGKKVLSRLKLQGDELVLDAGCGTGRLTAGLLEALPQGRVVGIDQSQNMLGSAREHLVNYASHVSLVACDLLHLPFENAFNGIVSTAAFHWITDHDRLFANLHRALVPGGWLEAQCGGGPNIAGLRERVRALAATTPFSAHLENYRDPWLFESAEGAAETLRRAGFSQIETSVEPALTVLENAAHYNEYVRNIVLRRHLQEIPTERERGQFMAELTEQAAQDDPPFSLDYSRLNLRGRKI